MTYVLPLLPCFGVFSRGFVQEAINCYRTTLRLKADHPHAYNNLGNAMKDKVSGCRSAVHYNEGVRTDTSGRVAPGRDRSVVRLLHVFGPWRLLCLSVHVFLFFYFSFVFFLFSCSNDGFFFLAVYTRSRI